MPLRHILFVSTKGIAIVEVEDDFRHDPDAGVVSFSPLDVDKLGVTAASRARWRLPIGCFDGALEFDSEHDSEQNVAQICSFAAIVHGMPSKLAELYARNIVENWPPGLLQTRIEAWRTEARSQGLALNVEGLKS